jgi:hypothetical protein
MLSLVLAHEGGWDEIAMVLGPILLMGGLLYLANRRAAALEADDAPDRPGPDDG